MAEKAEKNPKHEKHGRNSCICCVLPSSFLIPPNTKKYGQFGRVFHLIYTLYHSEHEKHGRIGCVFCVLPSPFLLPSLPNPKIRPVWLRFFVFGFFSTTAVVSVKSTAKWPCFSCFSFVSYLTPTQTRKMRPIRPRFSCLGSSLKNHGQSGRFFCVLA